MTGTALQGSRAVAMPIKDLTTKGSEQATSGERSSLPSTASTRSRLAPARGNPGRILTALSRKNVNCVEVFPTK
eukprot:5920523-Amphidinium_carterae.1